MCANVFQALLYLWLLAAAQVGCVDNHYKEQKNCEAEDNSQERVHTDVNAVSRIYAYTNTR